MQYKTNINSRENKKGHRESEQIEEKKPGHNG